MRFRAQNKFLVFAFTLLILSGWLLAQQRPAAQKTASPGFESAVLPFISRTCYPCHNDAVNSGGLNLKQYTTSAAIAEDRGHWEKVLQRLKAREMPPKEVPPPDETELKSAMAWIEVELDRLDTLAVPDPGRVTVRRLNRAEYNNTVEDLLGVDFHPADNFPQDDSGYGFDNIGDVLSLSAVQMEKYLKAAETVARTAVYGPQSVKSQMIRVQPSGRRRPGDSDNLFFNTHPYYSLTNYDETGLSMPNSFHVMHRFPASGEYLFRVTPDNGSRPAGSEKLEMGGWIDGVQVGTMFADGDLEGNTQEFRVKVTAGEHWLAFGFPRQFEGLPAAYGAKNPSKRPAPAGRGGRGAAAGATNAGAAANNDATNAVFAGRLARADNMRIQYVEIGGPTNPELHPSGESVKRIYVCGKPGAAPESGCDRRIISNLARLAYRRPVTSKEVDDLMVHVIRARNRGDSFEEQLVLAIEAMLVSPHFLYRVEQDPPRRNGNPSGDAYTITDLELASRLSYFLWSSMPDEELLRVAEQKNLHKPEVLAAQAQRMMKDPNIHRFVQNFGGQWLQIRALESHTPDFYLYPQFDNYLQMSMARESELFFENIIKDDRNILEFLDADYTYVNEYLAQYYRIPDVKGPEFRKVSLAGTPRRGLLGQASVLTISSYPNRTSVVLRGKWILDNILNSPPPPPPANVPNLEDAKIAADAPLRERMEAHRTNAVCATCHRRMDPLGLGLENFDAIGNWREKDGKTTIDASGTLPDGRTFRGPVELAGLLRADGDEFARSLAEKTLTYALGRGLEPSDRVAVRKITDGLKVNQYRFSGLVLEIAKSLPFQNRRGNRP